MGNNFCSELPRRRGVLARRMASLSQAHELTERLGCSPSVVEALFRFLTFRVNELEIHRGYLPGNWDILWSLSIEEMFYLVFPRGLSALWQQESVPSEHSLPRSTPRFRRSWPIRPDSVRSRQRNHRRIFLSRRHGRNLLGLPHSLDRFEQMLLAPSAVDRLESADWISTSRRSSSLSGSEGAVSLGNKTLVHHQIRHLLLALFCLGQAGLSICSFEPNLKTLFQEPWS